MTFRKRSLKKYDKGGIYMWQLTLAVTAGLTWGFFIYYIVLAVKAGKKDTETK